MDKCLEENGIHANTLRMKLHTILKRNPISSIVVDRTKPKYMTSFQKFNSVIIDLGCMPCFPLKHQCVRVFRVVIPEISVYGIQTHASGYWLLLCFREGRKDKRFMVSYTRSQLWSVAKITRVMYIIINFIIIIPLVLV